MTAALSREVTAASFLPPALAYPPAADEVELARDVAQAWKAMGMSTMGTGEYEQALRWCISSNSQLLMALGARKYEFRMPRSRQPLPFFPALRRVHRPEVA